MRDIISTRNSQIQISQSRTNFLTERGDRPLWALSFGEYFGSKAQKLVEFSYVLFLPRFAKSENRRKIWPEMDSIQEPPLSIDYYLTRWTTDTVDIMLFEIGVIHGNLDLDIPCGLHILFFRQVSGNEPRSRRWRRTGKVNDVRLFFTSPHPILLSACRFSTKS